MRHIFFFKQGSFETFSQNDSVQTRKRVDEKFAILGTSFSCLNKNVLRHFLKTILFKQEKEVTQSIRLSGLDCIE